MTYQSQIAVLKWRNKDQSMIREFDNRTTTPDIVVTSEVPQRRPQPPSPTGPVRLMSRHQR